MAPQMATIAPLTRSGFGHVPLKNDLNPPDSSPTTLANGMFLT